MTARVPSSLRLRAAVSVSQMARLLAMSRSNFYTLVERGVFLPPVYSLATRRPFFTADMQERNLEARETGIGCNGEYVLFYERAEPKPGTAQRPAARSELDGLMEGLRALGLGSITAAEVRDALAACFPEGASGTDESEVLRAVYRRLRRSGAV